METNNLSYDQNKFLNPLRPVIPKNCLHPFGLISVVLKLNNGLKFSLDCFIVDLELANNLVGPVKNLTTFQYPFEPGLDFNIPKTKMFSK